MSSSNASARKRRAPPPIESPPGSTNSVQFGQPNQPSANPSSGLTLPQVILLIDKRLSTLEKFMTTTNSFIESQQNISPEVESETPVQNDEPEKLEEIVDEFNVRYSMLAEEIVNIKTMLLNLQNYTMDVNKKLFEKHMAIQTEDHDVPTVVSGDNIVSEILVTPGFPQETASFELEIESESSPIKNVEALKETKDTKKGKKSIAVSI